MALINVFSTDPGEDILTNATQINIVEQLASAIRYAGGRGTIGLVGAVVNDRGAAGVPLLLQGGIEELLRRHGGFKSWMGEEGGGTGPLYDDRGAADGYRGNLVALCKGADAPVIVLQPVDLAIKDLSLSDNAAVDLLISVTRSDASNGAVVIPAGTRLKPAAGAYVVATLEDVSYGASETGSKTVRARQVSPSSVSPVAINTIDTFLGEAAGSPATGYAGDANITVNTAAVTVPDAIDAAELVLRYNKAFGALTSTPAGGAIDVVVCDRTEAGICDDLSAHCESATAEGYFRIGSVAPPLATSAATAQGSSGDGVGRSTLKGKYVTYVHPGIQRQFRDDADNLVGPQYLTTMAGAVAFGFRIAQEVPEANPARPHALLENMKMVGVEVLDPAPNRRTHEQAGIVQPVLEREYGRPGLSASFHAGVMANGTKIATRRMAHWLYQQYAAIAVGFHKTLATPANQRSFLGEIDALHERLLQQERIAAFTEATGVWDPVLSHFTASMAVDEIGNKDVITLRPTFGPNAVANAT